MTPLTISEEDRIARLIDAWLTGDNIDPYVLARAILALASPPEPTNEATESEATTAGGEQLGAAFAEYTQAMKNEVIPAIERDLAASDAAVRALLASPSPDAGWKLVPVEPTEAMARAHYEAQARDGDGPHPLIGTWATWDQACRIKGFAAEKIACLRAAILASPSPPVEGRDSEIAALREALRPFAAAAGPRPLANDTGTLEDAVIGWVNIDDLERARKALASPSPDALKEKKTMTLTLTDEEMAALEALSAKQELSPNKLMVVALRRYQSDLWKLENPEKAVDRRLPALPKEDK